MAESERQCEPGPGGGQWPGFRRQLQAVANIWPAPGERQDEEEVSEPEECVVNYATSCTLDSKLDPVQTSSNGHPPHRPGSFRDAL